MRGTDGQQARVLHIAAIAAIVIVALVVVGVGWGYPHLKPKHELGLSVDVHSVAPGVAAGTKVILHGAEVGEVTSMDRMPAGTVRMGLALRPDAIPGLNDAFDIDFRPQNYFGVTAINLVGRPGGNELVAGQILNRVPAGDFTMSTMLEKGSLAIDGTLTKSMISTLDKVIRYSDGLTPMIEAGVVFTDRAAKAQQALPSELMGRMNDVLAVLPAFNSEMINALHTLFETKFNHQPDGSYGVNDAFMDETDEAMEIMSTDVFGGAGKLLSSHGAELTPVTGIVQALSDGLPGLLAGGASTQKLQTLVDRYNAAFSESGDYKTLNLRIILDDLPGMSAPLAASGVSPQTTVQEGTR
ncbi:Mammalian cell entry related domain protein [Rhodococcus aetherivorans]|nr:Mammalian cell entry related domain protein [Rhodococcus aetherivorans]